MAFAVLSYGLYWESQYMCQGTQSRPRADQRAEIWYSSRRRKVVETPEPCSKPPAGHLLGCPLSADKFKTQTGWVWNDQGRPFVDHAHQAAIYVLYDDDFRIVYIGQTGVARQDLLTRLKQHKKPDDPIARRWTMFSWFGLYGAQRAPVGGALDAPCAPLGLDIRQQVDTTIEHLADQLEGILITAAEPSLNRQGGRWSHAVQYQQLDDLQSPPVLVG